MVYAPYVFLPILRLCQFPSPGVCPHIHATTRYMTLLWGAHCQLSTVGCPRSAVHWGVEYAASQDKMALDGTSL